MLWATAGQIHSHHYHKPRTKGLRLLAQGLSVRGLSFPRRGIPSSTQLLFGPGPRIGEHHVPAFTVLPHPETDPQSQGQYSRQGKQLLIQGWGTQHHQQGQGGAPLRVAPFWPAVASVPATLSVVAAFLTVPVVEVVSAVLVIGWGAGWRDLTVIAVKQTLLRVALWVAPPIPEEKPALGMRGTALPGVWDPQGTVPSIPVPSWAAAAGITGSVATAALTPIRPRPLTPGPRRVRRAGALKARVT